MARSVSRPKSSLRKGPRNGSPSQWVWAVVLLLVVVAGAIYVRQVRLKEVSGTGTPDVVTIETSKGIIEMEIYPDLCPVTVANFEGLADANFYNGLIFHRVENWVIQTGDPQGTGHGGSEKTIKLEINRKLSNVRGAVGMARSTDPNSASSQFYILKNDAKSLDGNYAIFGMVTRGMDVVDKISIGDRMVSVTVKKGTPAE